MNRFEKEKRALEKAIRERIDQYKGIYKKADDEDRKPTDDERLEIESHLQAIETLREEMKGVDENIKTLQHVDDIGRELGPAVPPVDMRVTPGGEPHDRFAQALQKSLGEQFTDSAAYKSAINEYREGGNRLRQGFSTGAVALEAKGTLLEGAGSPGAGTGGGFIPVPQVVPGVVETLFQPLRLADLLLSGQASGNTIRYVVEGTATSGAAGVAEAGNKPESTLAVSTNDEPIKKIATLLPIAEEMLEDAPAVQSYINGRLSLFVRIEEERQLFRGTSGGNEVQGILTSRNVPIYAGGTAAGNKAEQLFKAMNGLRGSAFLEPEWIVLHPTDWQDIRLLKDTANQYYGGGPFLGPYGGPQGPAGASGQISGAQDSIWGKPVYVTAAIGGAGTALIGTRAGAQVWRRGGISVEATNSHSTFFALNLVAIRAEERLGLTVYRPGAYVEARIS
jgi:HK97 family phage major capsid protein